LLIMVSFWYIDAKSRVIAMVVVVAFVTLIFGLFLQNVPRLSLAAQELVYGYTLATGSTGNDNLWALSMDHTGSHVYQVGRFHGTVDLDATGGTDSHVSNGTGD